jgi:transcriptional regulator with XRE-family HTH domain
MDVKFAKRPRGRKMAGRESRSGMAETLRSETQRETTFGAPTLEQAIGQQIKAFRQQLTLTASAVANLAGISSGMLSKIENGQISASLGTLQKLAKALNLPLTRLLTTFEEMRDCSYVPTGTGVQIERRGAKVGHQYRLLGHCLAGDISVEPYLINLAEDAIPYTAFQHSGTELIYMLSGQVSYRYGERTYVLSPGDTLMFDAAVVHGPEELIVLPASYLSILSFKRN